MTDGTYFRSFAETFLILLGPAAVLGFFVAYLRYVRAREVEEQTVRVLYEPPRRLTPLEVALLYRPEFDPHIGVLMLVELELRGYVRVTAIPGDGQDYWIDLLKPRDYWTALSRYESEFLGALFEGRDAPARVTMSEVGLFPILLAVWRHLDRDLVARGYLKPSLPPLSGVAGFLALFLCGSFGVASYFFGAVNPDAFPMFMPALALTLAATGGVLTFGVPKLPRLGPKGQEARDAILGFREFLVRAEKPVIEALQTEPERFTRLLPYAIALGVEERWVKAFSPLRQVPAGGAPVSPLVLETFLEADKAAQLAPLFAEARRTGKRLDRTEVLRRLTARAGKG